MKGLMGLLLLALPLLAQDTTPVPTAEQWLTGSVDVGYRWRTDVAGSFETYRSLVNLGAGPKFLGADFTILDPGKRLFDKVEARAADWGGDPYSTLHVSAQKAKRYWLNADYRNIAYFNNLPSFADPLLTRGIVLNEQSFDTRHKIAGAQLDLLPGNWLVPYLAFDRNSDTGTGVNAYITGGNEYPVPVTVRNSMSSYRGGVRMDVRRLHVTLEQGGTVFKDDENVYRAGVVDAGNNPVPLLGQTLNLTSLSQAYGIRGTGIYSRGLVTASATSWLDLYGQFLYSRSGNDIHYQEFAAGSLATVNPLQFFTRQQYLLSAEAKLPHTSASAGAEIRPWRRLRVLPSWLTDRLESNSLSLLTSHYNRAQMDVLYDLTARITLRGGYRYVWGEATDWILPAGGLTGFERSTLRQNVGIGGVTYRVTQKLSLHGDVEGGSSGRAYFRTSLYDYQKLRVRARYRITPALQVSGDATLLNNQNPTPGIQYDYFAHQESASLAWSLKGWSVEGSYTRSTVRSDINYLAPQTLTPEESLYRDNSHTVTGMVDGRLFGGAAKFSVGGAFFRSSGSRPTRYYQPLGRLSVPLGKQMALVSEWRYYGFGETFSLLENFRTHLVTTGVRLTR